MVGGGDSIVCWLMCIILCCVLVAAASWTQPATAMAAAAASVCVCVFCLLSVASTDAAVLLCVLFGWFSCV